jgi:tetratricopeptide (TPR) repeat protein
MNPDLQRALLLTEQHRPEMALEYFQRAIGAEPGNAAAHASFALCLSALEKFDEAETRAREAVQLEPDGAFNHYALGYVLNDRNYHHEAADVVEEAIRLEPDEPMYWGLLAAIRGQLEEWQDALDAADNGLQHDPTHPVCINMRGLALQMTGRGREAVETTDAALARDPENPMSHFTRGMTLLESGQRKEAMYHFRECLRLDPNFEPARDGIVDALKAANPLYRPILKFSFWLARKGSKWGVILPIGLWVLLQVGRGISSSNPELAPYTDAATYAYGVFVLLTWLGPHVFDFVVLIHPLGRLAMPRPRKIIALVIAAMGAVGGGLVLAYFLTDWLLFLTLGVPFLALTMPVSGAWRAHQGWPRKVLVSVAGVCIGLTLLSWASMFFVDDFDEFMGYWTVALWACAISSWVAIFITPINPKR